MKWRLKMSNNIVFDSGTDFKIDTPTSLSDKINLHVNGITKYVLVPDLKASIKRIKDKLCGEMINNPELTESRLDRIPQSHIFMTINEELGAELNG